MLESEFAVSASYFIGFVVLLLVLGGVMKLLGHVNRNQRYAAAKAQGFCTVCGCQMVDKEFEIARPQYDALTGKGTQRIRHGRICVSEREKHTYWANHDWAYTGDEISRDIGPGCEKVVS